MSYKVALGKLYRKKVNYTNIQLPSALLSQISSTGRDWHSTVLPDVIAPDWISFYSLFNQIKCVQIFAEIIFNRGCCKIKDGSPVCPPGPDDQYIVTDSWTNHVIRCTENLCNNGQGDGTDNSADGANKGGAIIVNGRSRASPSISSLDKSALLSLTICISLLLLIKEAL